jgi:hypothetical protein
LRLRWWAAAKSKDTDPVEMIPSVAAWWCGFVREGRQVPVPAEGRPNT